MIGRRLYESQPSSNDSEAEEKPPKPESPRIREGERMILGLPPGEESPTSKTEIQLPKEPKKPSKPGSFVLPEFPAHLK